MYQLKNRQNINTSVLNKYDTFAKNVKNYYLSEALFHVLTESIGDNNFTGYLYSFGRNICRSFVQEEGYEKLLNNFKRKTLSTALLEEAVSKSVKITMQKTDKNDELTFTITDNERDKFFNSVKNIDIKDLNSLIYKRVCDSSEEFIQNQINNKMDIEEVAEKTKNKIENIKQKYDEDMAKKLQQEAMIEYKKNINNLKSNKKMNVYEYIFKETCKSLLEKDNEFKNTIITENGLDFKAIEDITKVMYTFLEMVNTLKIRDVDANYINECVKSINFK